MPNLQLKSIAIRNWMTIKNAEIEFPSHGLVLVTGHNRVSNGKLDSIGSGKTSIGEALCRALVGTPGRYAEVKNYSTKGKGNTLVQVNATLNQTDLQVLLGYKCPELSATGERLRYLTRSGASWETVERGHTDHTREELCRTVGVSPELSQWTVYVDGDRLKFNQLSQKQCVELVMSALNQPDWMTFHENSKKVLTNLKSDHTSSVQTHVKNRELADTAQQDLETARQDLKSEEQVLEAAQRDMDVKVKDIASRIQSLNQKVTAAGDRQKVIKSEIRKLEVETAEKFAELDINRKKHFAKLAALQKARDKAQESKSDLFQKQRIAEEALSVLKSEPEQCPTCGKPWDKKHGRGEITEAEKTLAAAQARHTEAKGLFTQAEEDVESQRDAYEACNAKLRALNSGQRSKELSLEYEKLQSDTSGHARSIHTLESEKSRLEQGPDQARVLAAKTVIKERQRACKKSDDAIKESAASVAEAETAVRVGQYWHEAFGPTGIPNMILRDCIAPMNAVSKRISALMTGGTIDIGYSTTKELASGKERAQLVIEVNNKFGASRMEGNSKGEAGLTNLIIAETLSEVGCVSSRVGFRWYDEVINSQDPVVRRSILNYMKELAHRLKILVFVVDHHQEVESYADHVLMVEKLPSGTTARWL